MPRCTSPVSLKTVLCWFFITNVSDYLRYRFVPRFIVIKQRSTAYYICVRICLSYIFKKSHIMFTPLSCFWITITFFHIINRMAVILSNGNYDNLPLKKHNMMNSCLIFRNMYLNRCPAFFLYIETRLDIVKYTLYYRYFILSTFIHPPIHTLNLKTYFIFRFSVWILLT